MTLYPTEVLAFLKLHAQICRSAVGQPEVAGSKDQESIVGEEEEAQASPNSQLPGESCSSGGAAKGGHHS